MLRKLSFIVLIIFYISKLSFAQDNFLDKSYYLVDSLSYNKISNHDLLFIDSCLKIYHDSSSDTTKINSINYIIEKSWNDEVWGKYNLWLYKHLKNKIKNTDLNSNLNFYRLKYASCLNVNGLIFNEKIQYDSALYYFSEALKIYNELGGKSGQASTYNNIGLLYDNLNEIDSAIQYYNYSLSLYKKLKDEEGLANTYSNLGYIYRLEGNTPKVLEYNFKSLAIDRKQNNKTGIALTYNNIGGAYEDNGNIKLALEYYNKSLLLKEELEDIEGIAIMYNNIGSIYNKQRLYDIALKNYSNSLKIYERIDNKIWEAFLLNNIGSIYFKKKDYNQALIFYEKSLTLKKELKDEKGVATTCINIGLLNNELNKLELAYDYYKNALSISNSLNDTSTIALLYNNIGGLKLDLGEIDSAKFYCEKSFDLAKKKNNNPQIIESCASLLSQIAIQKGDYKKAFEMYQLEIKMRDSILNKENYRATIQQQTQYEYDKKKATDSIKNAVADKIKLAKLREVELENEKNSLELEVQKRQKLYSYLGLLLVIIFSGVIFNRFRASQKQKSIIQKQKEATEKQKRHIEEQHKELEESHKEINDSIKYSERLQKAIFPSEKDLKSYLRDHFILFQPKDTVSGDFYWLQKVGEYTFFAVGDCTGHGVPGAMVSVVCSNALNRSIKEFDLTKTDDILTKTRELVIETFSQSGKDVRDGMDIALCSYREGDNNIMYSGANNSLWIIRKTKYLTDFQKSERSTVIGNEYSLIEFKANKQPIGLFENMGPFNQTRIDLFKNDTLYLFTDGFADQFGGEKGKKFKYKPFKKMLLSNNHLEMGKQRQKIFDSYINWKGNMEQVDDICIVGIKI